MRIEARCDCGFSILGEADVQGDDPSYDTTNLGEAAALHLFYNGKGHEVVLRQAQEGQNDDEK